MGLQNINPWLQIWIYPKRTMRSLLDTDPKRVIIWLAIISGILSSFATTGYLWTTYPQWEFIRSVFIVIVILILGGIAGLIHLYIGGWLYKLTGSWLGGVGTFIDVKCAVGWSSYPIILTNIISLFSLLAIPNPWFQGIVGLITFIIAVWGIVIFLNILGEAHRFSAWRALLAVIIAFILIFVAVMIISLVVPLLAPLF